MAKNVGTALRQQGFDASRYNRSTGRWSVRCSRCEATVINGVACHEYGCPNQRKEKRKI